MAVSDRKPRAYRTPTVVVEGVKHGTPGGYTAGCRCEECKARAKADRAKAKAAARERGLPVGDPRHGTSAGEVYYGCKCDLCQGYAADRRAKRRAEVLPVGDERHGVSGYINYTCRCEICTAAESERQMAERAPGRVELLTDPEDPRHGTPAGYDWHQCKCGRCLEANRLAKAALRTKRRARR